MFFKRLTALMLAALLILSLAGCKSEENSDNASSSEAQEDMGFVPGNETLTITIPNCAVDIISDNLYAMAASFGISDIRDGSGGSVVCYIEYADKADVQMAAKKNLVDTTEYLIQNTDFIISGEVGYDCDSFTFFCDKEKYIEPSDIYLMSYYIPALTYHALATPDQDFLFNKKMTFTFLDSENLRLLGEFEFTGDIRDKEKN